MSIKLSDSIRVGQQKPLEDKYFNELVPYASTSQVNTLLPKADRHIGLTVNINREEYWYKDGIENSNLVLKVYNIDTSNFVTYTGATKSVNIGSYFYESAIGFKKTGGTANQALTANGDVFDLETKLDKGGYTGTAQDLYTHIEGKTTASINSIPRVGYGASGKVLESSVMFQYDGKISIGTASNPTETLDVNGNIKATGYKTPTGTANKALTSDGNTFDLNTKADLVGGKIPSSQLPSYVDDVLEYANLASFPATGESGKIYIALDTNLTYRWGGSSYVVMSSSLALGETSSTAYRGDRGKIAYDHSQVVGNPHGTTKTDIGLGNVPNIDATNPTNIVQTSSYRFVTDSEKTNFTTAYNHSQATGNPHNTKIEELTDVSGDATSIADTDIILKKESGGLWKKITFANFKNWFTTALTKKINIGLDTVFNFKNISAMALTDFRSIIPDIETIYFTEEQNSTGWQQIRYNGLSPTVINTTEYKVSITDEDYLELDSDSTFNLIDVANTKINGIFEKDFVIIKYDAGVITPSTPNQWFKVILKINNVQVASSPVFYLTEPSGTIERISHSFALNVPAEMVAHGATLHLKTSLTMSFNNPAITVVRLHKSTSANI